MSIFKESYNKQFKDFVCMDEMGNLRKTDYVSHKFKEILKNNDLRKRNIIKRNTGLARTFQF